MQEYSQTRYLKLKYNKFLNSMKTFNMTTDISETKLTPGDINLLGLNQAMFYQP